jgi:hypothetical protein
MHQKRKYRGAAWLVFFISSAALAFAIISHWQWLTLIIPFVTTSFVWAMDIVDPQLINVLLVINKNPFCMPEGINFFGRSLDEDDKKYDCQPDQQTIKRPSHGVRAYVTGFF